MFTVGLIGVDSMRSLQAQALIDLSMVLRDAATFADFLAIAHRHIDRYLPVDWVNMGVMHRENGQLAGSQFFVYNSDRDLEGWWDEYLQRFSRYDALAAQLAIAPAGTTLLTQDLLDRRNPEHELLFEAVNRRTGSEFAMATNLVNDEDCFIVLVLNRNDPRYPFHPSEKAFFGALTPLLQLTARTLVTREKARLILSSAESLSRTAGSINFLFDEHLRPLFVPRNARERLEPFFPEKDQRPVPQFLQQWLERVAGSKGSVSPQSGPWRLLHETPFGRLKCAAMAVDSLGGRPTLWVRVEVEAQEGEFFRLRQAGLSERETEVVTYLPLGYTNRQIAEAMGIQEITVKKHLQSIGEKLGAAGRTEILYQALQRVRQSE
ncbi:MAG: LuxR family transcriptional regulator [Myxococcales bacterium]|nr:MAG: LuxR family transcriptional regulator [Myxococcales bacterium]